MRQPNSQHYSCLMKKGRDDFTYYIKEEGQTKPKASHAGNYFSIEIREPTEPSKTQFRDVALKGGGGGQRMGKRIEVINRIRDSYYL